VRKDLPKSQQAVQAGHAVAEYLLRGPFSFWGNGTLVYLGVHNEKDLKRWADLIDSAGYEVVSFFEPDRGNEMTAFATECNCDLVKQLKLL
jgi:hypothetical protein